MLDTTTDNAATSSLWAGTSLVVVMEPPVPATPRRRRVIRWLRRITTAALVMAVAAVAFVGYGLVDNRWYHIIAVEGGSMAPTIEAGDAIVVTRPPAHIEVGMILVLSVDGRLVTHRVVEVDESGFHTKGDANEARDDFSENEVNVVGLYRFRLPEIGQILDGAEGSGAYFAGSESVAVVAATDECFAPCEPDDDEATAIPEPGDQTTPYRPMVTLGPPTLPPDPEVFDDETPEDQADQVDRSLHLPLSSPGSSGPR